MSLGRRVAHRKAVHQFKVAELTSLEDYQVIAQIGTLVDVSSTGVLVYIDRKDLLPEHLRNNLSLKELEGLKVAFSIDDMKVDLDGVIARADHVGNGFYAIGIDYSESSPEYWRECLVDLIPAKDEPDLAEEG